MIGRHKQLNLHLSQAMECKGDSDSWNSSISADGRFVAFQSDGTNLVSGDTNKKIDIFVRDMKADETQACICIK